MHDCIKKWHFEANVIKSEVVVVVRNRLLLSLLGMTHFSMIPYHTFYPLYTLN